MVAAKNSSSVSESSAPRSQVVDSTLATWTLALVSRTVEEEADQRSLLLRHGLRLEDLALPDARISHDATCSIWEELTFGHPDPIVGIHFAATLPESTLGIVGYLAMSSETPLDALRRVAEYYRLLKNSGAMGIVEQGERVHVVDRPAPGLSAWPRHLAEGVLFAYKAFIERWTRRPLCAVMAKAGRLGPPGLAGRGDLYRPFPADCWFFCGRCQDCSSCNDRWRLGRRASGS